MGACAATALLAVLILWWTLLAPSPPRILAGAILALPLVMGLPFLYTGKRRSYAWMTLGLTPSLVLALTELIANSAMRTWAALVLFDVMVAFALLVAYLRATRSSSLPSQMAP